MATKISRRIEAECGVAGLFDALANLPPTDLQSLLLDVFQARSKSAALSEPVLLAQSSSRPLLAPSAVSARLFNEFDRIAFESAASFEAIDLSPAGAFGASYLLGGTSQNNVLTTIRSAEVLGDSTIAMAFEAAQRRRLSDVVRLCASHRVIRLQPFEGPGMTPHFRLFAMISAGRAAASHGFEIAELKTQIEVYLRLFRLLAEAGFEIGEPLVELTDFDQVQAALEAAGIGHDELRESIRAHWPGGSERFLSSRGIELKSDAPHAFLEANVIEPLRASFVEAEFKVNLARLEGLGYYRGFGLRISPKAPDGKRYPVADGGFTDWTARLLGNRKERLLISGIGSEFLCKKYRS